MGLLDFPENTTIVFADNSPGWMMTDDFYTTKRARDINYGSYYHHGLISSGPHLAQAVPPTKTAEIFKLAVDYNSDYYAIMNVGNVREFVLGIQASRDMLENIQNFDGETWTKAWCAENFGEHGALAFEAYKNYFDSFVTDEIHETPLLLDGLARRKTASNINYIGNHVKNPDSQMQKNLRNQKPDAFYKSLSNAYPGGQMSSEQWLEKAHHQDSLLAVAYEKANVALSMMHDNERRFFESNLIAHIKFMQCLTGWVVESSIAVLRFNEGDLGKTRHHLEKALENYTLYEEAVSLGSRGKWHNWYRGEKKIDVKALKDLNKNILALL
jgi:hypothetical protein